MQNIKQETYFMKSLFTLLTVVISINSQAGVLEDILAIAQKNPINFSYDQKQTEEYMNKFGYIKLQYSKGSGGGGGACSAPQIVQENGEKILKAGCSQGSSSWNTAYCEKSAVPAGANETNQLAADVFKTKCAVISFGQSSDTSARFTEPQVD